MQVPVVGVANNKFQETDIAEEVFRGRSKKPLYVTSVDISQIESAANIAMIAENSACQTSLNSRTGRHVKIKCQSKITMDSW